jgi:hypothetical protein
MTFARSTAPTRSVKPSWQVWKPLPYMERARDHLVSRHSAGLPLRPGYRKTSITLSAFCELQRLGQARTMLVIAPLKVCRNTWRQEGAKWEEFRHLKFTLLHGPKKDDALKEVSDIYLINPEGVEWLANKFFGRSLPFDVCTIDELTKFKNSQSVRVKKLRPRLAQVKYRWGLTGSLNPNGHMDLFGQMLMLDDGAALGRYVTHYRDKYFRVGWDGFSYELAPGAEQRIAERLAPYWFRLEDDEHLQLPPVIPDERMLTLSPAAQKLYDRMKKDMVAELPQGVITAANAAACYSKLAQMANGAVYLEGKREYALIHDEKLDALEDLVAELNGEQMLVAYEFNHDFERLRERFGVMDKITGQKVLPYLGKGVTAAQEDMWIKAWNRGELPLLFAHPASAGHGLNLQEGNAHHLCWFSPIWDFELYDQFIGRLCRSGNVSVQIINHTLMVKGTIDELKVSALNDKDTTQGRFLKALNTEIRRSAETMAAMDTAVSKETDMVARLSRPGGAAPAAAPAESDAKPAPKGWGSRGATAAAPSDTTEDQRERIQSAITGGTPEEIALAAAEGALNAGGAELPADAPKTRTRKTADAAPAPAAVATNVPDITIGDTNVSVDGAAVAIIVKARVELLKLVFADPETTFDDGLEMATDLWAWCVDPEVLAKFEPQVF